MVDEIKKEWAAALFRAYSELGLAVFAFAANIGTGDWGFVLAAIGLLGMAVLNGHYADHCQKRLDILENGTKK